MAHKREARRFAKSRLDRLDPRFSPTAIPPNYVTTTINGRPVITILPETTTTSVRNVRTSVATTRTLSVTSVQTRSLPVTTSRAVLSTVPVIQSTPVVSTQETTITHSITRTSQTSVVLSISTSLPLSTSVVTPATFSAAAAAASTAASEASVTSSEAAASSAPGGPNTGVIVGTVGAAIVGIAAIIAVAAFVVRRMRKRSSNPGKLIPYEFGPSTAMTKDDPLPPPPPMKELSRPPTFGTMYGYTDGPQTPSPAHVYHNEASPRNVYTAAHAQSPFWSPHDQEVPTSSVPVPIGEYAEMDRMSIRQHDPRPSSEDFPAPPVTVIPAASRYQPSPPPPPPVVPFAKADVPSSIRGSFESTAYYSPALSSTTPLTPLPTFDFELDGHGHGKMGSVSTVSSANGFVPVAAAATAPLVINPRPTATSPLSKPARPETQYDIADAYGGI